MTESLTRTWYVLVNDQWKGPFSLHEIQTLLEKGEILPTDYLVIHLEDAHLHCSELTVIDLLKSAADPTFNLLSAIQIARDRQKASQYTYHDPLDNLSSYEKTAHFKKLALLVFLIILGPLTLLAIHHFTVNPSPSISTSVSFPSPFISASPIVNQSPSPTVLSSEITPASKKYNEIKSDHRQDNSAKEDEEPSPKDTPSQKDEEQELHDELNELLPFDPPAPTPLSTEISPPPAPSPFPTPASSPSEHPEA